MASNAFGKALRRLQAENVAQARWVAKARLTDPQTQTAGFALARIARELVIRDAISQSCLAWIKSNRWPMMQQEDALFAWERIDAAREFGAWLRSGGFSDPAADDQAMLVWLLVDYWNTFGVWIWKAKLLNTP